MSTTKFVLLVLAAVGLLSLGGHFIMGFIWPDSLFVSGFGTAVGLGLSLLARAKSKSKDPPSPKLVFHDLGSDPDSYPQMLARAATWADNHSRSCDQGIGTSSWKGPDCHSVTSACRCDQSFHEHKRLGCTNS